MASVVCVHFTELFKIQLLALWTLLPLFAVSAVATDMFSCPAIQDSSVKYFDVRLPMTTVPTTAVTTYMCQAFEIPVPRDKDYHAVAFQPLIANEDVMHHMILFACPDSAYNTEFLTPHTCGRVDNQCRSWMAQWSMGINGIICLHNGTGVRFGQSVGSSLLLQIHWNNAKLRSGLQDNSGMRIYYTIDLRPYDLGHVQVGQQDIEIPPGVNRYAQRGGCSSDCTQLLLANPIYLTSSHIHMHYLGAGGWLEIVHNDGIITRIVQDDTYDFSYPTVHIHEEPVPVLPGDYLRLTCLFSSKDGIQKRNETIYFGEGSEGEMCYAFLSYYPHLPGFDQCLQFDVLDLNCPTQGQFEFNQCVSHFTSELASSIIPDTVNACRGRNISLCQDECKQALDLLHDHHCLQGRLGSYVEKHVLPGVSRWKEISTLWEEYITMCSATFTM